MFRLGTASAALVVTVVSLQGPVVWGSQHLSDFQMAAVYGGSGNGNGNGNVGDNNGNGNSGNNNGNGNVGNNQGNGNSGNNQGNGNQSASQPHLGLPQLASLPAPGGGRHFVHFGATGGNPTLYAPAGALAHLPSVSGVAVR